MNHKQLKNISGDKPLFGRLASAVARWSGSPAVFVLACAAVIVWGVTGPMFGFSETWQLVINTATTIITFLMVFLIQNTQTRDTQAMQLKLDELIRATKGAHTALLDLEELDEQELLAIRDRYEAIARRARQRLRRGEKDTDIPRINLQ
jgi:low affinity Fe/Cu permease